MHKLFYDENGDPKIWGCPIITFFWMVMTLIGFLFIVMLADWFTITWFLASAVGLIYSIWSM